MSRVLIATFAGAVLAAPKPHIVFLLQDDLGLWDTAIHGNDDPLVVEGTANITKLATEGVILNNHYVHWHCSPTRRTFLTGRLPLHHGEHLSNDATDDMDLRWTWISEKLQSVGYKSYWFGKGHTGYKSWQHMPVNRGFDGGSVFFLGGSGSYTTLPRWNGTQPLTTNHEYSTDLFGSLAVKAVEDHDPSVPLFLYLPWQAVHGPLDLPPSCADEACPVKIPAMMRDSDRWTGALVDTLKTKGMYDNTLIVYSADNGGVDQGNNYPLRGEKHTSWQGAFRVSAFVSGGFVPAQARGTVSNATIHVADWYSTFCSLAGVDGSDDPPVPPLDPSGPTTCSDAVTDTIKQCGTGYNFIDTAGPAECCAACDADEVCTHWVYNPASTSKRFCHLKSGDGSCSNSQQGASSGVKGQGVDIYGDKSYPPVDGQNVWKQVIGQNLTEPHPLMWLSAEVMIKDGRYSLVVAQPSPQLMSAGSVNNGWKTKAGKWQPSDDSKFPCNQYKDRTNFRPCLFDLLNDPRQETNLAEAMPELVAEIWTELNRSALTSFRSRSPSNMVGKCDKTCTQTLWNGAPGPECGVPGCDERVDELIV